MIIKFLKKLYLRKIISKNRVVKAQKEGKITKEEMDFILNEN